MSLSHFFRILMVRKAIIICTVVAALLAAITVIKVVPPRYTATSRVMLDIIKPDPITGVAMSAQYARAFVATQIELISDYKVAGRVVDSAGWTSSPDLAAAYEASGAGPNMSFRRWLSQKIVDGTQANLLPGSNILEISYTSDRPEAAAQVADALRDAYDAETRLMKQQSATQSATWFTNQTTKLRNALTEAEKKKAEFERANNIVINDDLTDVESGRLAALASAQDAQMPPMMAPAPVVSPSQTQLVQIDAQIDNALRTLGPNHPRIVAMRQQRAAVAANAAQELAAGRASQRMIGGGGPSAEARYSAQQAKVLAQRGKLAEGRQLAMNIAAIREQLANAERRTGELKQQADSDDTGLSYLGSAIIPSTPSFPKIPLLVSSALAVGLVLGVLLAILIEMLARKVRGPHDLVALGVPFLGVASLPSRQTSRLSFPAWSQRLLPKNLRVAT